MRRFGESVKRGQNYRVRPGVYAVLLRGKSLLLTHQQEPTLEYQLPGGGIDPGEHPIAALHREVYEETGYSIAIQRKIGVYKRFAYMPDYDLWAEKICMIYLATPVLRKGPPTEAGHTAIWVPASEGLDLLDNHGDWEFLRKTLMAKG